ncbi:MAG: metal-dependent phosphohydrolase [Salaquimonas sp.]
MFNPTSTVAAAFGDHLAEVYNQYFSGRLPDYSAYISGAARLVLERIGNSDALYHNAEHTMMVTLVGQQIIRGRLVKEHVTPEDWLNFIMALLVHDIGYARGICDQDTGSSVVINENGDMVPFPNGATDAFLTPYHVDRGLIYVRQRFSKSSQIDVDRVAAAVDFTRFPVPDGEYYADTNSEMALVRAADLIGQMADPYYYRKINNLYHEFVETGTAQKLGYTGPVDLVEKYPNFFWSQVQPLIGPALHYLEQTMEGKQWISQLYNNLFQIERQLDGQFAK